VLKPQIKNTTSVGTNLSTSEQLSSKNYLKQFLSLRAYPVFGSKRKTSPQCTASGSPWFREGNTE
jgi:hypothetical protein